MRPSRPRRVARSRVAPRRTGRRSVAIARSVWSTAKFGLLGCTRFGRWAYLERRSGRLRSGHSAAAISPARGTGHAAGDALGRRRCARRLWGAGDRRPRRPRRAWSPSPGQAARRRRRAALTAARRRQADTACRSPGELSHPVRALRMGASQRAPPRGARHRGERSMRLQRAAREPAHGFAPDDVVETDRHSVLGRRPFSACAVCGTHLVDNGREVLAAGWSRAQSLVDSLHRRRLAD